MLVKFEKMRFFLHDPSVTFIFGGNRNIYVYGMCGIIRTVSYLRIRLHIYTHIRFSSRQLFWKYACLVITIFFSLVSLETNNDSFFLNSVFNLLLFYFKWYFFSFICNLFFFKFYIDFKYSTQQTTHFSSITPLFRAKNKIK